MLINFSSKKTSDGGFFTQKEYHKRFTVEFIFPQVRKIFPRLIANELVGIQPMTRPSGLLFYLDYIYGKNKMKIKFSFKKTRYFPKYEMEF